MTKEIKPLSEKYSEYYKGLAFKIKELKEKVKNNWKEREEDDKYWSGVVETKETKIKELKKDVAKWKGQYNSKLKRDQDCKKVENYKFQNTLKNIEEELKRKRRITITPDKFDKELDKTFLKHVGEMK